MLESTIRTFPEDTTIEKKDDLDQFSAETNLYDELKHRIDELETKREALNEQLISISRRTSNQETRIKEVNFIVVSVLVVILLTVIGMIFEFFGLRRDELTSNQPIINNYYSAPDQE